jgi:DHA3 family macrolide efflux protein-like MFS transporter
VETEHRLNDVRSGYRALLRNPAFCTLLGAEVLLRLGQSILLTTLPWLLLDLTGSNSSVGWATAAVFSPYLLAAIPAGALVDRVDRRVLMPAVTFVSALLAAAVPVLHATRALAAWNVLLIAFLLSTSILLFQLGRSSILPQIVAREALVTANAAQVVLTGLAAICGNALVGPLVQAMGLANSFAFHAAFMLLSAGLLTRLALPTTGAPARDLARLRPADVFEGLAYARQDRLIRSIFVLDALYFVVADGLLMTGIPLFVKDVLGAGPEVYSYTRIAGNVGMLLGALWLGQFGRGLSKGRVIVAGWLGYGLALLLYPLGRSLTAALAASFLASLCGNLIPASGRSLLQERVPPEILGRVFGLWAIVAPGAGTVSAVLASALASVLPSTALIAIGAAVACGNAFLGRQSGLWGGRMEEDPVC